MSFPQDTGTGVRDRTLGFPVEAIPQRTGDFLQYSGKKHQIRDFQSKSGLLTCTCSAGAICRANRVVGPRKVIGVMKSTLRAHRPGVFRERHDMVASKLSRGY